MKIGKITNTNNKGQIVIPQEYREMLGIKSNVPLNIVPKYNGLFITPIEDVIPKSDTTDVYKEVLKDTQGAWGEVSEKNKKKEKLELDESAKRKQEW